MGSETEKGLSTKLAESIRNLSAMISRGAGCEDVAAAAVQCAVTLLPGSHVMAIETKGRSDRGEILAMANAQFVARGETIAIADSSVMSHALREPFRVHQQQFAKAHELFRRSDGFPLDPDAVVSCKSVPVTDDQGIILAAVCEPQMAVRADGVLMALSELLAALCAGYNAVRSSDRCRQDIVRAKREWERTADALPELVCLVDQHGNVVRANRTFERWGLGKVHELQGVEVHDVLHPDCSRTDCYLRGATSLSMAATASDGHLQSAIDDDILKRTLIVHTRLIEGLPERSERQVLPSAVIVVSDISALHKAQQELSALNSDLERRVISRTAALQQTNEDLAEEIARRRATEQELKASRDELENLTEQLIDAQEAERERLSRELHDSLGQSLGAVKYSLESVVAAHANSANGEITNADLAAIIGRVGDLIRETRSLATGLRPHVLDELGIASAIRALCRQIDETYHDIEFHIDIEVSDDEVPPRLATPIYRIVQEGLSNVVKHASAESVMVALRLHGDVLCLEILDDGIGFEDLVGGTGAHKALGKLGRVGMRERAAHSNGALNIESWPGEGTRIKAQWPLTAN